MHALVGPVAAVFITVLIIWFTRPVAVAIGLVDRPNERKSHSGNIPLVGGLAIFVGFMLALSLFAAELTEFRPLITASILLVLVGAIDDFHDLSPAVKVIFQVLAALLMSVWGAVAVTSLGSVLPGVGPIELGIVAIPFTVAATVGIINAVNLSDGLDGLAGSQMLVAFVALAYFANRAGAAVDFGILTLLIGGLIGFLFFNLRIFGRRRASVFMGDAGTMLLGFAYVWFAVKLSSSAVQAVAPTTVLWIIALPVFDTVTMLIRRIGRGRSPFIPDKEHLHHVLLMAGFTVNETVFTLVTLAALCAGVGVFGEIFQISEWVMFGLFLAAGIGYLAVILWSWAVMRFLRWSICRRRSIRDRRRVRDRRSDQSPDSTSREDDRRSGGDRRYVARRTEDATGTDERQPDRVRLIRSNR